MRRAKVFLVICLGVLALAVAVAGATPTFLLKWGEVGSGSGQFLGPNGIAVDRFGHVFVADTYNNRIQKFTSDGVFLTQWGIDSAPGGLNLDASKPHATSGRR